MAHLPSQHYRPGKTTLKLQALGVSPPVEAILRPANNEASVLRASVGGAIAGLRWWSYAQPPAHRVRPLQGPKPKPRNAAITLCSLKALIPDRAKYNRRPYGSPLARNLTTQVAGRFPPAPPRTTPDPRGPDSLRLPWHEYSSPRRHRKVSSIPALPNDSRVG